MYGSPFYIIIYGSYKIKNWFSFWPTLYVIDTRPAYSVDWQIYFIATSFKLSALQSIK